MNDLIINIIGYSAAAAGTVLMLPQVIKVLQTKSVKDISFLMLAVYALNCILWLTYGILITSVPLILCNAIAFVIALTQIFLKLKYSPKN